MLSLCLDEEKLIAVALGCLYNYSSGENKKEVSSLYNKIVDNIAEVERMIENVS